jgi:hypothetical protein
VDDEEDLRFDLGYGMPPPLSLPDPIELDEMFTPEILLALDEVVDDPGLLVFPVVVLNIFNEVRLAFLFLFRSNKELSPPDKSLEVAPHWLFVPVALAVLEANCSGLTDELLRLLLLLLLRPKMSSNDLALKIRRSLTFGKFQHEFRFPEVKAPIGGELLRELDAESVVTPVAPA